MVIINTVETIYRLYIHVCTIIEKQLGDDPITRENQIGIAVKMLA